MAEAFITLREGLKSISSGCSISPTMATNSTTIPQARTRHIELRDIPARQPAVATGKAYGFQREATGGAEDRLLKAAMDFSTRQIADPFQSHYAGGIGEAIDLRILEPEFPLDELAKLCIEDVTLTSCLDAMATNVSAFGYTLEYVGPDKAMESAAAVAEKTWIQDLMDRCNPDESFQDVRDKVNRDYNTFGHAYLEVGRDIKTNVEFIYHIPAQTMRATAAEDDEQEVVVWLRRDGTLKQRKAHKRFRRFVQVRKKDGKRVYFKEFGDVRPIRAATGKAYGGTNEPPLPLNQEAVEVIWVNRYSPGYVYGLPKYIACIAAILGSKEAALTNLDFFKDNAIPALAVLVAGAMLTDDAVNALRSQFTKNTGRKMINRAVVLEARTPTEDMPFDGSSPPVPRLDIKPLTQDRQGDALFQTYTKNNSDQTRQSFRLPPLVVGLATDYTRATAEASLDMAEAQVFGPERQIFDEIVNSKLLLKEGKPTTFWRYRSNAPKVASPEAKMGAMEKLDAAGALTPNIAITLANSVYGFQIPSIKEKWGDLPFSFVNALMTSGKLKPDTGIDDAPEPEPPTLPVSDPPNPPKPKAKAKPPVP